LLLYQFITFEQQDSRLDGFSIDYVHITSELIDSQVLSFSLVGSRDYSFTIISSSSPLNDRALSLMFLSQLCQVRHL